MVINMMIQTVIMKTFKVSIVIQSTIINLFNVKVSLAKYI